MTAHPGDPRAVPLATHTDRSAFLPNLLNGHSDCDGSGTRLSKLAEVVMETVTTVAFGVVLVIMLSGLSALLFRTPRVR